MNDAELVFNLLIFMFAIGIYFLIIERNKKKNK